MSGFYSSRARRLYSGGTLPASPVADDVFLKTGSNPGFYYCLSAGVWTGPLPTSEATAASIGTLINSATAKTTPVDADVLALSDSAASNVLKKLSWANVKATLKTYFDGLYAPVSTVKVYRALLTQSSTDAPVATVLENSLGATLVWAYVASGRYTATLAGAFPANKVFITCDKSRMLSDDLSGLKYFYAARGDNDSMRLHSGVSESFEDDCLSGYEIKIEVNP